MKIEENDDNPIVLIRCATYNHEKYIARALDGFVMQKTKFPFIAIIHDDASKDRTSEIIHEYAEKYPDIIKPIYEKENLYSKEDGSLRRKFYKIVNQYKPKYIAFCEGDDFWTDPNKLQKQVYSLECHKECSICVSKVMLINKDGTPTNQTFPNKDIIYQKIVNQKEFMYKDFYLGNWSFHLSSYVVRKSVLDLYNDLCKTVFKDCPYGDIPLLLTGFLNGKIYYIPEIMSCYRILSGGYTSNIIKKPLLRINHETRVINSYNRYDELTSRKFHKEIKLRNLRGHYKIVRLSKNIISTLNPKFYPLYKFWGLTTTIGILLDDFVPSLYKISHFIFRKITNR